PAPELVHETLTASLPPATVRVGVGGGVQPGWVVEEPGSEAQAMPCRSSAAKIAPPCGVPLVRSPSSSSAARRARNIEPMLQPFEVQVGAAVEQEKAAEAVGREE